jgi:membrane protein
MPEERSMSSQATAEAKVAGPSSGSKPAGIITILKETAADWSEDKAVRLSAALSLYTILSLAPLLILTLKVVSLIYRDKARVRHQMLEQLSNLMGRGTASDAIKAMLDNGTKPGSGVIASVIGTILLLSSAAGVFIELQDSMNTIWGVKPKPNQGVWGFIRNRLLSMGMVLGIAFLLLVSMFISSLMTTMAQMIAGDAAWVGIVLDVVISFGVVTVLFAAIFRFLPDAKVQWKHVWLGAVMTALLFTLGKYGLTLYFKFGTPTSAFGAAGSIVAVLLWVYYSSFILFFGAEFTKVWAIHHGHPPVPDANAVKITEEDRAQQGMPSDRGMQQALSGRVPGRAGYSGSTTGWSNETGWRDTRPAKSRPVGYMMTAAGALAAGFGAHYLLGKSHRSVKEYADATALNQRLENIEGKLGRTARIKRYLEEENVHDRMHQVETQIRRAGRKVRAQETNRPQWLVRAADFIGGRWSNL